MRGSPGRIGGKGLEAIGQGELVPLPTGPSHHPPTLCCQLTHTPTHKGWGGLWRAEVCHGGLVSNAPSLLAGNPWAVMTQWGWNQGGTLEQQPPWERGHRSAAPTLSFQTCLGSLGEGSAPSLGFVLVQLARAPSTEMPLLLVVRPRKAHATILGLSS